MNERLENPAAGPSRDAAGLSDFKVLFSPETRESLVWFKDGNAARLREETKDENLTASEMGNSPGVIFRHYRALVRDTEVVQYWGLRPSNVGQG